MVTLKMLALSLAVFSVCIVTLRAESSYEAQSRLEAVLLTNYSNSIRPVLSFKDNVTVTVGISLSRIQDMNDKNQILTLNIWVRQVWYDPRLTWNSSDYAMTEQIHVNPKKIWVPDLKVYNEVGQHQDHGLDQLHTKAVIYFTGRIQWMSPLVKKLSCRVDMTFFPRDTQSCKIKIGSWTYDGYALDVKPENHTVDVSKSPSNSEWELISTSVKRNLGIYKCCKEPYPDVTYTVVLKRRERSYWMNFIFPGTFLTVITMMTFVTPAPDTGERISLVLTSLVSMFFFLKLVSERTPATDTTPLLSVYFVMLSFEIGFILYSVCLSLNAYHKHPAFGEMPGYVRNIVLKKLGNFWRLSEDRKRIKRRLGALQNLALMKNSIKNELENIRNGLSHSKSALECDEEQMLVNNCNDACSTPCKDVNGIATKPRFARSRPEDHRTKKSSVKLEDVDESDYSTDRVSFVKNGNNESSTCTCPVMINKMVRSNKRLLYAVRKIIYVARQFDKTFSEKESWLIAAIILDRVFLMFFVIVFIIFSLINFLW